MSKKKIAVMQPYFFPYIGYFQLINAVDKFVLYDDVNFIKNGWINRNRILSNIDFQYINMTLIKPSSNKIIRDIEINTNQAWEKKILKQIEQSYSKAPYFKEVLPLIKTILNYDKSDLSNYLYESINIVKDYLDIDTEIEPTSSMYDNKNIGRKERLIDICNREGADCYINLIGGMKLYKKEDFKEEGIELLFLEVQDVVYEQYTEDFISNLSIIDVMMFNSKQRVKDLLNQYSLI